MRPKYDKTCININLFVDFLLLWSIWGSRKIHKDQTINRVHLGLLAFLECLGCVINSWPAASLLFIWFMEISYCTNGRCRAIPVLEESISLYARGRRVINHPTLMMVSARFRSCSCIEQHTAGQKPEQNSIVVVLKQIDTCR